MTDNAAIQTAHLDRAVARAKRLADLLHHRPNRDDLDLEAAEFLVYLTWLLENDSDSRKLTLRMSSRIGEALKRAWDAEDQPLPEWEQQLLDEDEPRQLRAGRGRAGEEIMRLQRQLNAARTAARNFRTSAAKFGEHPHANTFQAGAQHGYLMAADALDEIAGTLAAEASPDELEVLKDRLKAAEHLRDLAELNSNMYRTRWHEAATQRDALVRAARDLLSTPHESGVQAEIDVLRAVVERVEADGWFANATASRLRRELWHVLDRMPAGDDDLIASVKKHVNDLEEAGVFLTAVRSALRDNGRPPALRLADIATAVDDLEEATKTEC